MKNIYIYENIDISNIKSDTIISHLYSFERYVYCPASNELFDELSI